MIWEGYINPYLPKPRSTSTSNSGGISGSSVSVRAWECCTAGSLAPGDGGSSDTDADEPQAVAAVVVCLHIGRICDTEHCRCYYCCFDGGGLWWRTILKIIPRSCCCCFWWWWWWCYRREGFCPWSCDDDGLLSWITIIVCRSDWHRSVQGVWNFWKAISLGQVPTNACRNSMITSYVKIV